MGKKLFLFAAAAVALASCTETDLSGDTSFAKESTSDAIQFSAKAGNSGVTRAYEKGTIGNVGNTTKGITDLKEAQFGVFAYYTGADDYVTETPTVKEPNFMYNQQITWSTSNPAAWIYSPVKYWPNGIDADNVNNPSHTAIQKEAGQVSFFAVAPFTTTPTGTYSATTNGKKPNAIGADDTNDDKVKKNDATNGINAMTTNDFTGNVWVKYLMPDAKQSEAVDLLWGLAGKNYYNEADGEDPGLKVGEDYNINLTKQKVDEKVSFLFKHALAKIGGAVSESEDIEGEPDVCGFYVQVDVDENDKDDQPKYFGKGFDNKETLVTIKSVKIQDGKTAYEDNTNGFNTNTTSSLIQSGWFNIETGKWSKDADTYTQGASYELVADNSDADLTNTTYTLNKKFKEVASYGRSGSEATKKMLAGNTQWDTSEPTGVTTTAQPLFCDENVPGLMIIPIEGATSELYVTVDYVVRTADKNLKDGFTNVEQVITNKVSLGSLKPNKYYTIIMHLGLTSVKFEAKVADWTAKAEEAWDEDGKDTSTGKDNEEKVWLPSNVVSANQWEITPSANPIAAKGEDITLTTVKINDNTLAYQASPVTKDKYTLTESSDWLSIDGTGKITAEANNASTADRTAIVYVSTKVNDNTITTPITLTQKGFSLEKTSATGETVTVKDGDDQGVTAGYTVVVSGGDGAGNYNTPVGNTVTITGTSGQTYKVTITHTASGATKSVNVTIS
jgi:hypothetical protein